MSLVKNLRRWLVEKAPHLLAADADDGDVYKAASNAVRQGVAPYQELAAMLDKHKSAVVDDSIDDDEGELPYDRDAEDRLTEKMLERYQSRERDTMTTTKGSVSTHSVLSPGAPDGDGVRVKRPGESYRTDKPILKHKSASYNHMELTHDDAPAYGLSQLERAKLGAFVKYLLAKQGFSQFRLDDHEQALLRESAEKDYWLECNADIPDDQARYITKDHVKAFLDDSTSGGQYAVPEWFDSSVIVTPLTHSEILPLVRFIEVPHGSTVEGVKLGHPAIVWGTAEGTEQALYDTTDLMSQFSCDFKPASIYMTIGIDFQADAAINIGRELEAVIREKLAEELDRVIINGNSTTEISGILTFGGTTDISIAGGTTGSMTVDDMMNLAFAISKPLRNPIYRPAFAMTDTTYKRLRSIATGVTGDTRFVLGQSVSDYRILDWDAKILSSTSIDNQDIVFGAFEKYRLYRRTGTNFRYETGGAWLTQRNLGLLAMRTRYAGKPALPGAFAIANNAPA